MNNNRINELNKRNKLLKQFGYFETQNWNYKAETNGAEQPKVKEIIIGFKEANFHWKIEKWNKTAELNNIYTLERIEHDGDNQYSGQYWSLRDLKHELKDSLLAELSEIRERLMDEYSEEGRLVFHNQYSAFKSRDNNIVRFFSFEEEIDAWTYPSGIINLDLTAILKEWIRERGK